MNTEFLAQQLKDEGKSKLGEIAQHFDALLEKIKSHCPTGRELSLVKTKLEEAFFFAKKALLTDAVNVVLPAVAAYVAPIAGVAAPLVVAGEKLAIAELNKLDVPPPTGPQTV